MDALSPVKQPVEQALEQYAQAFDAALAHEDDFMGQVLEHVRARRGKLMRPLLVLLVAREAGPVPPEAVRSAVAVELLHTASLVHDDVVDESAERRGQPSTNAAFGNKVAVLMGDYLLSLALRQTALTGSVHCVDVIAQLGAQLAEGEMRQLSNVRNGVDSEEAYFQVIRNKTAALFATCGHLGAFTSGAPQQLVDTAERFGQLLGMCFQIRDDIFDYDAQAQIGKPTGNDMAEGKLTLPALYALTQPQADACVKALAARVRSLEATPADIAALVDFTVRTGGIDYARRVMRSYYDEAKALLDAFGNAEVRQALGHYLDYVVLREF